MMVDAVVVQTITVSAVEGVPGAGATSMGEITHLPTRTLGTFTVPPTPTPTMTGEPHHEPSPSTIRAAILGGVIGGASCLVVLMLAMILWWRRGCRCVRCQLKGRKSREQVVAPEGHYAAENGTDARHRSTFYSRDPIDRRCKYTPSQHVMLLSLSSTYIVSGLPVPLFDPSVAGRQRASSRGTTYSEFLQKAEAKESLRQFVPTLDFEIPYLPPNPSFNFSRPFSPWRENYNQLVNLSHNDNYKLEQIRGDRTTPTTLTDLTPDRQPAPTVPHNSPVDSNSAPGNTNHSLELLDPAQLKARYEADMIKHAVHPALQRFSTLSYELGAAPAAAFFGTGHMKSRDSDTDDSSGDSPAFNMSAFDETSSLAGLRDWDLPPTAPADRRRGHIFYPDQASVEIEGSPSPVKDRNPFFKYQSLIRRNSGHHSDKGPMAPGLTTPPSIKPGRGGRPSDAPLRPFAYEPPTEDVPLSASAIRTTHEDIQDIQRFDLTKMRPASV